MKREKDNGLIEGALVDAELFIKYRMPERALKVLREVVDQFPTNADLRWKLAEFCLDQQLLPLAGEQLLALAEIYIESDQFDMARRHS